MSPCSWKSSQFESIFELQNFFFLSDNRLRKMGKIKKLGFYYEDYIDGDITD